jgi:hypothetical protein
MRPLVKLSKTLTALALCGAVAGGLPFIDGDRRDGPVAPGPGIASTPGFYGGTVPPGLLTTGARDGDASTSAAPTLPRPASSSPLPPPALIAPPQVGPDAYYLRHHEYYFTRAIYSSGGGGLRGWGRRGGGGWATDYPKADDQFMVMVDHLLNIDLYERSNAVGLAEPKVRQYPFLYALEVGRMRLTDVEVQGLRDYLNAGGFLVIDDFWGTFQWENFEYEISRVLPGRPMVELGLDHPIFHAFYEIEEILQVPNVNNGIGNGPTYEQDGYVPHVLGIFDDHDRLMVVINWNTDLGDAWEWAENPYYPLKYSRFAAEMGINMIVYAMSH